MTNQEKMFAETARERAIMHDLLECGRYLKHNVGGRGGKSPILAFIYLKGGSISQRELIEDTALKSGSLSEVITKLESLGLVERTRSEADRRQVIVTLTDEGKKHAKEHLKTHHEFERVAFTCLTTQEQEQLLTLLDRVLDAWEAM